MTPIVLHHGLFGFGQFQLGNTRLCYFRGIDRALAERGHPLIIPRVHPTSGVERRARELKAAILEQSASLPDPRARIMIIAHSMGGLDARYMLARLGMAGRVAALITISTPHRGSPYADWCAENVGRRLGAFRLAGTLHLDLGAVMDLTTTRCRDFNRDIADVPGVRYFSVAGARKLWQVPPFLYHAWKIVHDAEGENDGLVSVASAHWGKHLATWPADHLHTINRRLVPEFREKTGDMTERYLSLIATAMDLTS